MKFINYLLFLFLLFYFIGCIQINKTVEETKLTNAISDMIMFGDDSRKVSGQVSNGIYFKTDEKIYFYSIAKLGDIVGDNTQIMEMILVLNISNQDESYLSYGGKAVSYSEYESASDFNSSKSVTALDVLPLKTIVFNVELGIDTYVDGTEIILKDAIIADHTKIDVTKIPEWAIKQASEELCIGLQGVTHSLQITNGMSWLDNFMNPKEIYAEDIFAYNFGGYNDELDLRKDSFRSFGAYDLGNPNRTKWEEATRSGLDVNPKNVVIWFWKRQVSDATEEDINTYLELMEGLEEDYPETTFVYMTGAADGTGETGNLHLRNKQIRDYCVENGKVLFDFYDIECYDPDGNYYGDKNVDEDCSYSGGNWGTEWQEFHIEGEDWYDCGRFYTEPISANMKTYAMWWLFARIAGWDGEYTPDTEAPTIPQNIIGNAVSTEQIDLSWDEASDNRKVMKYNIYRDDVFITSVKENNYSDTGLTSGTSYSYTITAVDTSRNESDKSEMIQVSTQEVYQDTEAPSIPQETLIKSKSSEVVRIEWKASTDNVLVRGYKIYRDGVLAGESEDICFVDKGLIANTEYSYQISAYDAEGNESEFSEIATVTTTDKVAQVIKLENNYRESPPEIHDSFLTSYSPDTNWGIQMSIGALENYICKFLLPDELNGKTIIEARVGFYLWEQLNYEEESYLDLYEVTRNWEYDEVTWNNCLSTDTWSTPGGDVSSEAVKRIRLQEESEEEFWKTSDITDLVQGWIDGEENYGIMLKNESNTKVGLRTSKNFFGPGTYLEIIYK